MLLIDAEQRWARQPSDLVAAIFALLVIVAISLLTVYARSTTIAVTSDVRRVADSALATFFLFPINILEGIFSFFLPLVLLVAMAVRRRWRSILAAVVGVVSAIGFSYLMLFAGDHWFPQSPLTVLITETITDKTLSSLIPYVAVITALLTVAGSARNSRLVDWGWILTGVVLLLSILQGNQTLPGALLSGFIGMFSGSLARYVIGTIPNRETRMRLVRLTRKAGIDPVQIVRIDTAHTDDELRAWTVTTTAPLGYADTSALQKLRELWANPEVTYRDPHSSAGQEMISQVDELEADNGIEPALGVLSEHIRNDLLARYPLAKPDSVSRTYVAVDADGVAYHLLVFDDDRQIIGRLNEAWMKLRLKLSFRTVSRTLHGTADHFALMQLAVENAGLMEPRFVSVADADQSIMLVGRAMADPLLSTVSGEDISDVCLDRFWHNLDIAHQRGLSHGNIHSDSVRMSSTGLIITTWHNGSLAATDIARSIDLAQGVAMLATIVGVQRTVDSLTRCMSYERIVSLAPLLQLSIMPERTRAGFKNSKDFAALREALSEQIPVAGSIDPIEVKRFSAKTIITASIGVVAVFVLIGSVNFDELRVAISNANPAWMVASFTAGLFTYVGAGLTLKAYTPEHIPLRQSVLVQVAASLVTLVTPAGIGPAALNLRFLQKKRVATAAAIATVTVVQVAQIVTTVLLLLALTLVTGELGKLSIPSGSVLSGIAVAVSLVIVLLLIRPFRTWMMTKIEPTLRQIWPRLVWLGTHPQRLLVGFIGSLLMTAAFVTCFGFALKSFGYDLPLVTLAVTYLVSNTVGSMVPSPGGIGPVEAALTGGLVVAGVPYSVALSTAVLYRLFTFWGRVPLGYIGLRIATKKNYV